MLIFNFLLNRIIQLFFESFLLTAMTTLIFIIDEDKILGCDSVDREGVDGARVWEQYGIQ